MATYWFKRRQDAMDRAQELRESYHHVTVSESHASYTVTYCCPKNEAMAALHAKVGARCQESHN